MLMIDFDKLQERYSSDRFYALQLEVGDVCYQNCIYCYMNALPKRRNELSGNIVHSIIEEADKLGIVAIEWLGGEPLLRNDIFDHMTHAKELGLRNNLWTGGLPLQDKIVVTKVAALAKPGLISVHLSTINKKRYHHLHPYRKPDDVDVIINGVKELMNEGYPPENMLNSVTFTGLQPANDMIDTIDFFEHEFGIKTSLNVYHTYLRPGATNAELEKYIPDEKEVAKVYSRYKKQWGVANYPMNCVNKEYCSSTIAILNNGNVTPCATIRNETAGNVTKDSFYTLANKYQDYLIFKRLKNPDHQPETCRNCVLSDECWGCRSRAYAAERGIYGKDPRCFRTHKVKA